MRGKINPATGVTDAALMTKVRSALRKVSSQTNVKQFKKSVRFRAINKATGKLKWHHRCVICQKEMPEGMKVFRTKKDGTKWKVKKSVYDVDHVDANPPLKTFDDVPAYLDSLIFGKLRILCWECHRDHGKKKR
jgi:hypothetical protein